MAIECVAQASVFTHHSITIHTIIIADRREEAEKKFQDISKAYESLMSTDEDTKIEQLAHA